MALRNSVPDADLRRVARRQAPLLLPGVAFGIVANLLVLTGPLYMLQVYDRVLSGGSEETLVALSVLAAFLFAMMGCLDHARGRIITRFGARLQDQLDARIFGVNLRDARLGALRAADRTGGSEDIALIRQVMASPVALAVMDLPWAPIFAAMIFVFHPALGAVAVAGAILLITIAFLGQWRGAAVFAEARDAALAERGIRQAFLADAEAVHGLGMGAAATDRWRRIRYHALSAAVTGADRTGAAGAMGKTVRLMVQAAVMGFGALLVLRGEISAGAVLAASILIGRALAPVEQVIGGWGACIEAVRAFGRLDTLLSAQSIPAQAAPLPRPAARIAVGDIAICPPDRTRHAVRRVSFALGPGEALGVIGPSGSGKSTLLRAIAGIWPVSEGEIRLGGVPLHQFDSAALGRLTGYLPQSPALFDGTIAENIARLDPAPDMELVVAAAQLAGAHELILGLPEGYDTRVSGRNAQLSSGQLQRVGLARAFYGDPLMLLLDEPNSALDSDGTDALHQAIAAAKTARKVSIIAAHRPGVIRLCDRLLVLKDGAPVAFGPTQAVLKDVWGLRPADSRTSRQIGDLAGASRDRGAFDRLHPHLANPDEAELGETNPGERNLGQPAPDHAGSQHAKSEPRARQP